MRHNVGKLELEKDFVAQQFHLPDATPSPNRDKVHFEFPFAFPASVAWQGSDEKQKSRLSMKEEYGSR